MVRHPFETVAVLATVLGVLWIVTGAIDVMSGITDKSLTHRGLVALAGIFSIGAGVVVVAWPSPTITAIAWVAGLYLIVHGLTHGIQAEVCRVLGVLGHQVGFESDSRPWPPICRPIR